MEPAEVTSVQVVPLSAEYSIEVVILAFESVLLPFEGLNVQSACAMSGFSAADLAASTFAVKVTVS